MFIPSNITPGDVLGRPVTASPPGTSLVLMVDPATDQLTSAEMQDIPAAVSGAVLQDGTAALTADWDAGAFEIRAETFQSDVATGTAPLIVASTTVVANLNADLLDGQHGSYYAKASDVTALTSGYSRRKSVINRVDNTAAPPTEVSGDRYLLDATGTSHANWDGALINQIVEFNGTTWDATAPSEGWIVYNDNSDTDWLYVDDGSPAWQERTAGGASDHGALSGLTDDDHTQYLLAAGTRAGTGLQEFLGLNLTDSTELTISSGAVTVTQGYHTIDTEGDASSDDLDTITVAGGEGDILILRAESSARTVVLKHGTGNIQCAEGYDLSLDSDYDYAILIRKDGSNWMALSGARRMPPYLKNGDTLGGALAGDIYYHDGTTVTNLRKGTNGDVLTLSAGLPSWAAAGGGVSGFTTTAKSASYTASSGDLVLVTTTASGDVTITLDSSPATDDVVGVFYEHRNNSHKNHLVITASHDIEPFGVQTLNFYDVGDFIFLQFDGSEWFVTSCSRPLKQNGVSGFSFESGAAYRQSPSIGGTFSSGTTLTADQLYYVPLLLSSFETLTEIAVHVTTAAASSNARLGIYTADQNGTPNQLILDAGEVDCSSTGKKTIAISESLMPGAYFLALVANSSSIAVSGIPNTSCLSLLGTDGLERAITYWYESHTYAALPDLNASSTGAYDTLPRVLVK